MWERLAAAISNAAAASRFRYILSDGNLGFEYNEIILIVKWMDSCQISLNVSNNMLIIEYTNCEMPIDTGIGITFSFRLSEAIPPFDIRYSIFCGSAVRF